MRSFSLIRIRDPDPDLYGDFRIPDPDPYNNSTGSASLVHSLTNGTSGDPTADLEQQIQQPLRFYGKICGMYPTIVHSLTNGTSEDPAAEDPAATPLLR